MRSLGRDRPLRRGAVALLAFAVAACEPIAPPSPSVSTSPTPPAPGTATSSPTDETLPSLGTVELHQLDPRLVPAGTVTSSNGQLLWQAGDASPSELWRYVPGSAQPELLFASPRADANITAVAAAGSGFTFVELSETGFGKGGWRIWFLSGPGAEPVEVDRGLAAGAGAAPTIAMDDERIVWAGFDEPEGRPVSRIRMVSRTDPGAVTTLAELPIREALYWFPALHGDELWYGVIVADFDLSGVGDEFHIETIDLADPSLPAVRFPGVANDFNAVVNDDYVVWKTVELGDAALNWGTLHVQDRRTQAQATIPVANANRPSIGDRYVAFEEITHSRLAVYDLLTGTVHDLVDPDPGGEVRYGGQSLSGRLLAFFTQGSDVPQIGWALLPD